MVSSSFFKSVPLDRIDEADTRYKISTGGPSGPLMASIERAGILSPPVLIPKTDTAWIIVSGFKRIAVLKKLGVNETIACVLDRNTELRRCIEIAVIDNTAHRKLNPVEQGRAILLLDDTCPDDISLCKAADELGVPVNPQIAKKLRVAAMMKPILQKSLVRGDVALPVALQLEAMEDHSAAEKIAELFAILGLGLNRQRELLDWLNAISRREGTSLGGLLSDERVQGMLDDPEIDHKQKSRLLRDHFRQMRYPEMVDAETRFFSTVKSLRLGEGVRLEPPPHFEGQAYRLSIDFRNHQELISRYRHLEKAVHSSIMASLWDIFDKP